MDAYINYRHNKQLLAFLGLGGSPSFLCPRALQQDQTTTYNAGRAGFQ